MFMPGRASFLLLAVIASGLAAEFANAAQDQAASTDPDYSNVNDILNGQRTLLSIDDVVIAGMNLSNSRATMFALGTNDSKPNTSTPIAANTWGSGLLSYNYTQTYTARMWDMPNAATIVVGVDTNQKTPSSLSFPNLPFYVGPPAWAPSGAYFFDAVFGSHSYPSWQMLAVGDLNQDGYDDLFLNFADGTSVVATAGDVNDIKAGNSPPLTYGPPSKLDVLHYATVGDFNGDGKHEVAGLVQLPSGGLQLVIYTVDPKTLALSRASQTNLSKPGTPTYIRVGMTTGRFTAANHDQLVIAYMPHGGSKTTLELIDFAASSLAPQEKTTYDFGSTFGDKGGTMKVKSGKFGLPNSPYDQVVFVFAWYNNTRPVNSRTKYINLLSLNPTTLAWTPSSFFDFSNQQCGFDIAVGNFDNRQPDPLNPGKTQPNLNDEIGLLFGTCTATPGVPNSRGLSIISPDPKTFELSGSHFQNYVLTGLNLLNALTFTQSDTQGRSYVLGEPTRVVVSDTGQPSVIMATPPMHVDFIPATLGGSPEVLNLSAIPDGFYTTYETTSTEKEESSTTNTTSWGFGAQTSVSTSLEIGSVEDGFGAKASAAFSAAQELNGVVETEHGNYQSKNFSARVQTGFTDHIWYAENRFNIYVYPVIGRTVCPQAKPNCGASEQVPLTVEFSAPDDTKYLDVDADLLPWYQPPWESGNVFSYPATYAQLQQIIPNLQKLSQDNTWRTDGSTRTEETSWTTEATNGSSTSFGQNYSFETELSVAGACCGGLVTGSASAQVNLSSSTGFNDLNKAITSLGKSTGIGINKPGTFLTPVIYNYAVTPFILGEQPPPSKGDNRTDPSDITTSGLLRTAFVADPLSRSSGAWWKQAYSSAPDVALNHPVRWDIKALGLENPIPPNCRQAATKETTMDCAVLQPSFPNNPFASPFHIMRGFFITSTLNPGGGPQLTTAKAGDKLVLQARVYNYSLAAMPSGSHVHVRFYAQPWNAQTHQAIGDSVLVNNADVLLDPIPPFSDDPGARLNWVLADTTFDTMPYSNQYLTFWVVVWIEDGSGNLVPELGSHGLKSIPGTLKSIADVQTEDYSNNVGFYNSEFYVFPSQSAQTAEASLDGEPASIDIGKVQLSTTRALAGQTIDVSALLSASGNDASGVTAVFYDGDPHNGGKAFGLELSPYIAQNGTYQVLAPYHTNTCGTHQLFVVVGKDTPTEILRRAEPVRIDCTGLGSLQP